MILSILICSLKDRANTLGVLLENIYRQIGDSPVEVLVLTDNKKRTTGEKRNNLLQISNGEYIVFIDDDDIVYDNYVSEILKAIQTKPDCVSTVGHYSIDGGQKITWKLSKDFTDHDRGILYRRTNHLSPVKRELALLAGFPKISNAEDKAYSEALNKYLKTETFIDDPIYHYDYRTENKSYK